MDAEETMKKQDKIRELKLKGFKDDEIASALDISIKDIKPNAPDLKQDTIDLYSSLQRDLTQLHLKELKKENSDSNIILNAIKLQAELQEKKLALDTRYKSTEISKNYIYDRDKEIYLLSQNKPYKEVAKQFNISELSVKQALDRYSLNLSEELKTLSPSIISETYGLDKKTRLKILEDAVRRDLTRKDIREIVNKIKNEQR